MIFIKPVWRTGLNSYAEPSCPAQTTSSVDLLSVTAAQARLLRNFETLLAEEIEIQHAAGRVLALDIQSPFDIPPFSNSSMDGFAVREADIRNAASERPAILDVVADIPAGKKVSVELSAGQAARIMTGAPLPINADCVVPVEDTDFNYRKPGLPAPRQVKIFTARRSGENIRPRGQDLRQTDTALMAGTRLRPQDIGLLSMLGFPTIQVVRRPIVAVFSSGDELVPTGQPVAEGQIYDSNSMMIAGMVEQAGGIPLTLGIARDTENDVNDLLDRAVAAQADLILSSAGVSVGAFDFVRTVVERHGQIEFWRVNMRPGKPLAFGSYRQIPFIGLPGNPVSAFTGFLIFVWPAIARLSGRAVPEFTARQVRLLEPVDSDGRQSYLRATVRQVDGEWVASLEGHQGSGNLSSLVKANALLIIPSGVKSLPDGSIIDAWLLE
jgi:molybdopterin molybdotransferase